MNNIKEKLAKYAKGFYSAKPGAKKWINNSSQELVMEITGKAKNGWAFKHQFPMFKNISSKEASEMLLHEMKKHFVIESVSFYEDLMTKEETEKFLKLIPKIKRNIKISKKADEDLKFQAKALALAVRNHMEDFHVKHLTDEQMKELNPLIRNSIYSFLRSQLEKAEWLPLYYDMIPPYWEEPEFVQL